MRLPGIFDNLRGQRLEGIFGSKKSPEQQWAENKAREVHSQLQRAGHKNVTVTVEVPQKSPLQREQERHAQPVKQSFIERFRTEKAAQIEARQQSSQTHKHTQR
jgi:hypothetical protein